MAEKGKHERIHGPYPHKRKWRCIFVDALGRRAAVSFETLEAANTWAQAERAKLGHESIGARVNEWLEYLRAKGRRESTLDTLKRQLGCFLRLAEVDRGMSSLTPSRAAELYRLRQPEARPVTHRHELARARSFARWAVKRGYLQADPWADVEPVGQVTSGKPQLRLDEARRWLVVALGTPGEAALCASLALLMGCRVSELLLRVVRDLDDGGRLLWIPQAKTRAGVRQVGIPEVLRSRLLAHVAGRSPTDRVFSISRQWVLEAVKRICRKAGVPEVSTHGLRGVHATVATQAGLVVETVARALGQEVNGATTRSAYIAPGTEASLRTRQLEARLVGDGLGGEPDVSDEVPRYPDPDSTLQN